MGGEAGPSSAEKRPRDAGVRDEGPVCSGASARKASFTKAGRGVLCTEVDEVGGGWEGSAAAEAKAEEEDEAGPEDRAA